MATFLEGTRGSGKSKYAVSMMQQYLREGRTVATNLDLFLDNLVPEIYKANYIRLPDFPRSEDLKGLGFAYDGLDPDNSSTYDEKKFGIVCIDELLTSFNSRNWNDPDRPEVINWIVQSRKSGWNLYLIGQDLDAVDKQIRETVITELYSCRSSAALFGGNFWNIFIKPWFSKFVPKFHICRKYDGKKKDKTHFNGADYFRRDDLHTSYKTGQQFKKDVKLITTSGKKPVEFDERASYTVISPNYFKKQEEKKEVDKKEESKQQDKKPLPFGKIALLFCLIAGWYWYFTKDDNQKITTVLSTQSPKQTTLKAAKSDTIDAFVNADFFITCSVESQGLIDYCFEYKGKPFYPNDLGYAVKQFKPCLAYFVEPDTANKIRVTCNPVYVPSEKPDFNDEEQYFDEQPLEQQT